jgi:hypothetical protein
MYYLWYNTQMTIELALPRIEMRIPEEKRASKFLQSSTVLRQAGNPYANG